jgi:hypothetical protein
MHPMRGILLLVLVPYALAIFIIEGVDRVSEEQDLSDHAIVKIGQPASFIIVVMIDDDVVCVKTKNARGL